MPHNSTHPPFTRAKPADMERIETLLDFAFGPGRLTRSAERLREGNRQIDRFAHIISNDNNDNALLAAIRYWPIRIGDTPALLLGPLVVHPDKQSQGLGRALIQHTLKLVDETDFRVVLLVGDLPYYEKSGFFAAPAGITMPTPVNLSRLLVRGDKAFCQNLHGAVRAAPDLC